MNTVAANSLSLKAMLKYFSVQFSMTYYKASFSVNSPRLCPLVLLITVKL